MPSKTRRAAASGSSYRRVHTIYKTGVSYEHSATYCAADACLVRAAHAADVRIPPGDAGYDPAQAVYEYRFDNSKAAKLLKLDCTALEDTTRDIVSQVRGKIDEDWVEQVASSMRMK